MEAQTFTDCAKCESISNTPNSWKSEKHIDLDCESYFTRIALLEKLRQCITTNITTFLSIIELK